MHKRTIIVSALSLGIAGALSAGAYVTSTGSASATVNAKILPLEVTVTPVSPDLTFGDQEAINVTVKNNNSGSVRVTSAALTLNGVPPGCPAGSFTLTPSSISVPTGVPIAAGVTAPLPQAAQLSFVDLGAGTNQTTCAPSTLSVHAAVS